MPFVHISLVEGRDPRTVRTMMGRVAAAVAEELSAPLASVRVVVTEVPATRWLSGGETIAERRDAGIPDPPPV